MAPVKTIAGGQNSGPGNGDWQDGLPGTSFLNTVTELFYFKDSNYIIFSDLLNNSIRKIRLSDNYTSTLNSSFDTGFVNGSIALAKFNHPRGIAQDKRGIFVNDGNNQKVRILFTKKSTEITQIQQRENQYCEDGKCIVTPSESKVFKGYQLFDLQGHVLIDNNETTSKIAFDKSVFPQGVYILKLDYEGNQYNLIKVYFGQE
ncbi:MAG: T9SS type A sorting domain-containing protein [Bacteroidetes bacterium]|nr:T9SS type A sorting domain-containing protein [Bacteroidota bacterium]